jgi:hypothetical protein
LTVDAEGVRPLDGVANLGVESVDPSVDVVLEELAQGRPQGGGGGGLPEDEVEDLRGHPRVDPLDDGEIILYPARIIRARDGVGGDVSAQIAATEVDVEEMTPMVVVVGC